MKKVKINQKKCLGCGTCTFIYPEMFEINNEGKAEVKKIEKIDEEKLKEAIESCPVEAIEIEEK